MSDLVIVVLAAGRGTRFGANKQLAPLGPNGELMLDYALRDAAVAGFTRAVVVASDETAGPLRSHLAVTNALPFTVVVQSSPRGTAHALVVGSEGLTVPFAVANADDWYGPDAFTKLAGFLRAHGDAAVVGYAAGVTLSPIGGVSRAVCRVDRHGRLLAIDEYTNVRRDGDRIVSDQGSLDETTPISMNLWGFAPGCIARLRSAATGFLGDSDREIRIPDVVGDLIARDAIEVTVLPTNEPWFGVTHAGDAAGVRARLRERSEVERRVLDVAAHFDTAGRAVAATPLVHGHIHETFVVACGDDRAERIVLQRINTDVFRDLDALAGNWRRIAEHVPRVARPVATRAGELVHFDNAGAPWRATRFVEHTQVLGIASDDSAREAAARAFAELTRDLDDIGPLAETIPRFHDLARRRADLDTAVAADRAGRLDGARNVVAAARRLSVVVDTRLRASGVDRLPVRTVHNDAKLDNVLVDIDSGVVACILDLDTVMPGSVLNDFGELARTAATHAAEDEPDLDRVDLDHERFAALARGYLDGATSFLTGAERGCLALAGPLLALENGVRFCTDHLEGDVYFRVHRPDHNLQRARVQLRLTELMINRIDELHAVIAVLAGER